MTTIINNYYFGPPKSAKPLRRVYFPPPMPLPPGVPTYLPNGDKIPLDIQKALMDLPFLPQGTRLDVQDHTTAPMVNLMSPPPGFSLPSPASLSACLSSGMSLPTLPEFIPAPMDSFFPTPRPHLPVTSRSKFPIITFLVGTVTSFLAGNILGKAAIKIC